MREDQKSQNLIRKAITALRKRWCDAKTWLEQTNWRTRFLLLFLSWIVMGVVGALVEAPLDKLIFHKEKVKLWSVTGCLKLADRDAFEREDTVLSIKPPEQELYTDGQFIVYKVPIRIGSEGKPSLLVRKGGYKIIQIALEENPPEYYPKYGLKDYAIDFQEKERNILIGEPIILERENVSR